MADSRLKIPKSAEDTLRSILSGNMDWDVDSPYARPSMPGGYQMSDPYMGRPIASALGQFSPYAGMAADALKLDRSLVQQLLPNALSSRGSLFGPSNLANHLLNQELNRQYSSATSYNSWGGADNLSRNMREQLLTGGYKMLGYAPDAASKAATSAMSNMLNPMNMAAMALVGSQNFSGMDVALKKGMFSSNLMTHLNMKSMMPGMADMLTPDQRRLFYGAGGEEGYQFEQETGRAFAVKHNQALMKDFSENASQYGGFNAESIGKLTAEMARTGALDYNSQDTKKTQDQVKGMAQALEPLRELFGEDIPELMNKLDKSLGTNAMATFSKEQLQAKALQLKHTAAVTGTSVEALGDMITTSQSYFQAAGLDKRGGFQAAMDTANLIAGKKDTKRLDEEEYRQKTLKLVSAQQERRETRYAAGAYVLWAEMSGRKDAKFAQLSDEQKMAKFQNAIADIKGPINIDSLSSKFGFSQQQIAAAAQTRAADDARKNTPLAASLLEARSKSYSQRKNDYISELVYNAKGPGGRKLYESLKGLGVDELEKKLRANGISLDMNMMDFLARQTLGQGFNAEQAEQLEKDQKQAKYRAGEVAKRSMLDAKLSKLGAGRAHGLAGLLEYGMRAGKEGGEVSTTVSELLGSVMGMPAGSKSVEAIKAALGKEHETKAAAQHRLKLLGGDDPKTKAAAESKAAELNKMFDVAATGVTESGKNLDLTDTKVQAWRRKGLLLSTKDDATKAELEAYRKEGAKLGATIVSEEESKLRSLAKTDEEDEKGVRLGDELVSEYQKVREKEGATASDYDKARRNAAFKIGAKNAGVDDDTLKKIQEQYDTESKDGKSADLKKIIQTNIADPSKREKLLQGVEQAGEKLGISMKPDPLSMILELVKTIANYVTGLKTP